MGKMRETTDKLNDFVHEYGIWAMGALLSINLYFGQRIISSVDESGKAVTILQSQVKSFESVTAGYVEMRISLGKLETRVETLTEEIRDTKTTRRN